MYTEEARIKRQGLIQTESQEDTGTVLKTSPIELIWLYANVQSQKLEAQKRS